MHLLPSFRGGLAEGAVPAPPGVAQCGPGGETGEHSGAVVRAIMELKERRRLAPRDDDAPFEGEVAGFGIGETGDRRSPRPSCCGVPPRLILAGHASPGPLVFGRPESPFGHPETTVFIAERAFRSAR